MDAVESSAGPSAINQVVRRPTTGWRMRWWTAALAARFASPSLSDVTTAGTADSSSAKSKSSFLKWLTPSVWHETGHSFVLLVNGLTLSTLVCPDFTGAVVSSQRSKDWRSRLQCASVRTVTTTSSMSSAPRAETELCQNILQSSLMSDNHMYSIGFITTGIKKRRGANENSFTAFSTCAHLPGFKKERNENHWSWTARSNQSPATARLYKLVYIVNIDHGLFNRTKKKQNKRSVSKKNILLVR